MSSKTYTYSKDNGKTVKVTRNYSVKNPNSLKCKENKIKVNEYLEKNKEKYFELEPRKRISTLIHDLKNDLNINVSYNGALSLLNKLNVGQKKSENNNVSGESTNEETTAEQVH